jgi:hypothetical protein
MSIQSSTNPKKQQDGTHGEKPKLPTKRTIDLIKETYCKNLKGLAGELSQSEVTYDGTLVTYNTKKCCFVKTEKNYRIIRNLELSVGVELVQANEEIKKNVVAYNKQNDDLVKALKLVLTNTKEAKLKFGELRDAANKLSDCTKDSCNKSQMVLLGCRQADDCNENNSKETAERLPDCCNDVCEIIEDLINIPSSMSADIDTICGGAAEIVGIQTFSNIKSLDVFQADFLLNAKAFDDWVKSKMTAGSTALNVLQEELALATKNLTIAGFALYGKRNVVEIADEVKDYLCEHECSCIDHECGCHHEEKDAEGRLANCKCDICNICVEVKDIYCNEMVEEPACVD